MNKLNSILLSILIIMTVITLGMASINQTMGFIYKTELGKTPCVLCGEQNPKYKSCFSEIEYPTYNGMDISNIKNLTFVGSQSP